MEKRLGKTAAKIILLLILVSVGCQSPEGKTTPEIKPPATTGKTVGQSKINTVEIKEMKFQPAEVRVTPGTTIVFINKDMVTHDVTEEETKAWSSKLLSPGKSWSMIAEKSANYYCSIHSVMKGKIIVLE